MEMNTEHAMTDSLIFDLARVTCEETIPVGFDENTEPAPTATETKELADPEMPF